MKEKIAKFHDKHYKTILIIPVLLLAISLLYIGAYYSKTGDFFEKDISLTGGTSITLYGTFDKAKLEADLTPLLDSASIREVSDVITHEQKAVIVETRTDGDQARAVLEKYLGHPLNEKNSSFEFTGASLSESFYKQLLIAILIAFVFMALVVFILFRTLVPSVAVIISAFADIVMALATVDILGIKMSSAGIVALLMLIGYSVDTDILLTTRMLKRTEGSLNSRIFSAFKTGTTMTLTSLFAILFALIIVRTFSVVLTEIFTILVIGLFFDLINTWITNVSLIKWYMHRHRKK